MLAAFSLRCAWLRRGLSTAPFDVAAGIYAALSLTSKRG